MGACGQRCPSQIIDGRCKHRCPTVVHFLHRCSLVDIGVWVHPVVTVRGRRLVPVNEQKQLSSMGARGQRCSWQDIDGQ